MESCGYTSLVSMLFCLGCVVGDADYCFGEDCSTTFPDPLSKLLPVEHPCHNVQPQANVEFTRLLGKWYTLALMSPKWNSHPMCETVEFNGTDTVLEANWRYLNMLEHRDHSATAEYRTTLNMVQSAIWVDTKPDQGHAVYLMQVTWHPYYLVLIKCYPDKPEHSIDVSVLSRYKDFVQRDIDLLLYYVKLQGVDDQQLNIQYFLWSMCESYGHLE